MCFFQTGKCHTLRQIGAQFIANEFHQAITDLLHPLDGDLALDVSVVKVIVCASVALMHLDM